jgi:hypothetical protein
VGGRTIGKVRIESIKERIPVSRPMIQPAVRIPKTKHKAVATMPVFRDIYSGLQSSVFNISIIDCDMVFLLLVCNNQNLFTNSFIIKKTI